MSSPVITKIEITQYRIPYKDTATTGIGIYYEPGASTGGRKLLGVRIMTNEGIVGEYISIAPGTLPQIYAIAPALIGKNPLEREWFYDTAKVVLRKQDKMGIGPVDIALWDFAGKYYQEPIYRLLGGHRKKLPAYASTLHGDKSKGGLSSPEEFADFAEQCMELGYKGFKIHGWDDGNVEREISIINEVGSRVGDKMALMTDPCCIFNTYADALKVGRACDDQNFFWYEDPMKDGGVPFFIYRKLRQAIKTPILQGEHLHLVEPHVDMAIAEATDFFRADPEYDGGITGTMKIAHAAEGFGMDVELHIAGPAQRHCMAAMRNSNFYEMGLVHPKVPNPASPSEIYLGEYSDQLEAIGKDGCVDVPEGPGLGVEYNWKGIKKYAIAEFTYD